MTLTHLGGTADGRTLHISGNNPYVAGEEVLVFLEAGGGGLVEMGVGAGKYDILRSDGQTLAKRQVGNVAFARVVGQKATLGAPPPASGVEPLADLEARIALLVGR